MRQPPRLLQSFARKAVTAVLVVVLLLLLITRSRPHSVAEMVPAATSDSPATDADSQQPSVLVASASGRISALLVAPGETVTKGQVIARLANSNADAAQLDELFGSTPPEISNQSVSTQAPDAPPMTKAYCDDKDDAVRTYYLHPDRIMRNGAPCLPGTQYYGNDSRVDYVRDTLLDARGGTGISCQGKNLRSTRTALQKKTNASAPNAVATAASEDYFTNVLNLIGSVHYWEPYVPVTVYDLGFTNEQVYQLRGLRKVTVRRLPVERLPAHFADFQTYAFKPFLFLDALRSFPEPCLLWQDSGQELRRPISSIRTALQKKGFFLAKTGYQHPTPYTNELHVAFFGLTAQRYLAVTQSMLRAYSEYMGLWECAGGIIGATRNTPFLRRVVLPWATCTLYRACISPEGTDRTNDRQDQTALNLILYYRRWKTGAIPGSRLVVNGEVVPMLPETSYEMYGLEAVRGKGLGLINADPKVPPANINAVLFSRKRFPPYPYHQFVLKAD